MTVLATVSVPAVDFAPGAFSLDVPDLALEFERIVPLDDGAFPSLRVSSPHADAVERALRADDRVASVQRLDGPRPGDRTEHVLFRIEWADLGSLVAAVVDNDGTVVDASGTADEWTLRLRFVDHESLSAWYRTCVDRGISLRLRKVHDAADGDGDDTERFGLTTLQRETLLLAFDAGYFGVPRETTLADLGARLGVSDAAVSERLRRGQAALIAGTLLATPEMLTES